MSQLRLLWGVHPVQFEYDIEHVDDLVRETVRLVHQESHISDQKDIVFTSGVRMIRGKPNLLGVFHVNDIS
jgi:pyruvate kinase